MYSIDWSTNKEVGLVRNSPFLKHIEEYMWNKRYAKRTIQTYIRQPLSLQLDLVKSYTPHMNRGVRALDLHTKRTKAPRSTLNGLLSVE